MRFINRTNMEEITAAITLAENLLTLESKMVKELRNKNDFRFGAGTGNQVATKMLEQDNPIAVYTFRPKNPFTKMIAHVDDLGIHFNLNKVKNLTTVSMAGTLLHERSHKKGFNHGTGWFANRKTKEKCLYSVPYFLSENVSKWL